MPCFEHFGVAERHFGVNGRVVLGGDAISELGVVFPLFLRVQAESEIPGVCVYIQHAWHNGFATTIDNFRIINPESRCLVFRLGADKSDFIALHHQHAVFNHAVVFHGDDAGIFKNKRAFRHVALQRQTDFQTGGVQRRQGIRGAFHKCKTFV